MKKKLLCAVLFVTMLLGVLAVSSFAGQEVHYDVWVNGTEFTSENATTGITCGNGKATYDSTYGIVTLTNADITKGYEYDPGIFAGIFAKKDIGICLVGKNTIKIPSSTNANGIIARKSTGNYGMVRFFEGPAESSLDITVAAADRYGIYADTVFFNADVRICADKMAVGTKTSKATFATSCTAKGNADYKADFSGCTTAVTATADSVKVSGSYAKTLVVKNGYGVYVNGEEFAVNMLSVTCGSGTATLDVSTTPYTLTLTDAAITKTVLIDGAEYGLWSNVPLKIVLASDASIDLSEATVNGAWAQGVFVNGTLTFSGAGKTFSVNANNKNGVGVFAATIDLGDIKELYATAPNYAVGSLNDLANAAKYGVRGSTTVETASASLTSTAALSSYRIKVESNDAKSVKIAPLYTVHVDVWENGTNTGKRFSYQGVEGETVDYTKAIADATAYIEGKYGTGTAKYFAFEMAGYKKGDGKYPATYGAANGNFVNYTRWTQLHIDTTLTIHADVYENGTKTGKRFTMTEVYGTTVDYDTLKANVAAYLEGIYGAGTAKYFDIEVHGYNETDNKLPTTFGQEGINWHSTSNKYLWITVYTKTLFTVHVDLFENDNENPEARFTVTGKIGEDIDFDSIMAQGEAFLDEKYGEDSSRYFGLYFSIYNLENTKGVPTGFGEEGKNWHGADNRTIWLRLNADTEFTFVGVLYDNGTGNVKQYKVTGLFGETIDYDAVETWARLYSAAKYPDVEEAHTYVEFKLPGKSNLPATLGDPAVNWHDPDKCWVNVVLTCEYAVNYTIDGTLDKTDYVKIEDFDEYTLYAPTPRRGYTFTGWYEAAADIDDEEKSAVADPIGAKLWNLYSRFDINTYNITYVMGDDSSESKATNAGTNPATYTVLDSVTFADPSRVGYTFEGWYADSAFTTPVTGIEVGTIDDQTVYAKWSVITYTITYVLNVEDWSVSPAEGTSALVTTYTVENDVDLAALTRRGYTFVSWCTDEALTNAVIGFAAGTTGDKTFYADWDINVYKIRYFLTGGKNATSNPTTYTVEDDIIFFAPATKSDFSFRGWFDNDTRALHFFIPAHSIGDVQVTASWAESTLLKDIPTGLGYTDVSTADWSYNGISFVTNKGYMDPTSATTFSPKLSTKRADVVYALWMMEGAPVVNYAMSFTDIEIGSKYVEAIRWASSLKIALGYSDTEFAPNDDVTREQFATFLYRYASLKGAKAETAELKFSDAAKIDDWATEAVEWCVKKGIIIGRDDGTFDPLALCKREEAATMIARFVNELSK